MPYLIDAHEDLAYNILTFDRDYRRSVAETRAREKNTEIPAATGDTLLGWPEFQRGQVALVFGTLFLVPPDHQGGPFERQVYHDYDEAFQLYQQQVDLYHRLDREYPDQFRLVRNQAELKAMLAPWDQAPAAPPEVTHPMGVVMLMEGAEGLRSLDDLEYWWQQGLRLIGPVWGGGRFCGGTHKPGGFTAQGRDLLKAMAERHFILDVSHMTDESAQYALDHYTGSVIASHANARALLKGIQGERHLTDAAIRLLVERDGVMGVMPFNRFLRPGWTVNDDRSTITLGVLVDHIDHVCQLAGDARHVGIGSDFDGGFGWPEVPVEVDTIADLQKLAQVLSGRGYSDDDVVAIFGGNWRAYLERALPRS